MTTMGRSRFPSSRTLGSVVGIRRPKVEQSMWVSSSGRCVARPFPPLSPCKLRRLSQLVAQESRLVEAPNDKSFPGTESHISAKACLGVHDGRLGPSQQSWLCHCQRPQIPAHPNSVQEARCTGIRSHRRLHSRYRYSLQNCTDEHPSLSAVTLPSSGRALTDGARGIASAMLPVTCFAIY